MDIMDFIINYESYLYIVVFATVCFVLYLIGSIWNLYHNINLLHIRLEQIEKKGEEKKGGFEDGANDKCSNKGDNGSC